MDLVQELTSARALDDPTERAVAFTKILRDWPQHHAQISAERAAAADAMHEDGKSWAEVGQAIGVTRGRASHIAKGDDHRRVDGPEPPGAF